MVVTKLGCFRCFTSSSLPFSQSCYWVLRDHIARTRTYIWFGYLHSKNLQVHFFSHICHCHSSIVIPTLCCSSDLNEAPSFFSKLPQVYESYSFFHRRESFDLRLLVLRPLLTYLGKLDRLMAVRCGISFPLRTHLTLFLTLIPKV
jgi:hypothetical protein